MKLFEVFNKTLKLQMRNCHFKNVSFKSSFFIGLYFNKTFKFYLIIFCQPFLQLLVEGVNMYINPSLFNISKCSFGLKTQDRTRSWFLLW